MVHTLHRLDADDGVGHLQPFCAPRTYTGKVTNHEPNKYATLRFRPLDGLPQPIVGYTVNALALITADRSLSAVGRPA
ncbi:NUDIX hydrolase [Kitasatospora sp. Ki12]